MSETAALPSQAPAPVLDDILYEVIDGRIVEKPPMGAYEGLVANWLIKMMITSEVVERLGQAVSEILFHLDPARDQKRRPDLAFVSFERWPVQHPMPPGDAWEVVPDLAVEVVSKSNTAAEILVKIDEYFQAGVRLVWVIYPKYGKIYAYTSPTAVRILQRGDDLDGGPVLPGFLVPVRKVFGERD